MPSTFSALKIELIATGEQSGLWGATTNTNLGTAIEEAITGSADVTFTSGNDVTLTLADVNTTQTARNLRLNLIGTAIAPQNLILGSGCQIEKLYLVNNTLPYPITVKNTTGTGITVPAAKSMFVYNNGTNVVEAVTTPAPRITSITSSASITPNADTTDQYEVTALATDPVINSPTGSPADGQKLIIRILDNGTPRALTWDTLSGGYRVVGSVLPLATVANKVSYIGCIWNSQASYWDVVAVANET